ncbi:prion-inhibition and propagation-domain-containing protein [Aspergillus unguis]
MEAAGLALSVVALFGSCLKGYQLVSDIKGLGRDSAILLCRLQIEERRLVIWGQATGFSDDKCLLPVHELDTVLMVLKEIHSITQDAAVMKKRYGASAVPVESDNQVQYIQASSVMQELKRRIDQKSPTSLKTGLRWMFDRQNFEKLVVDLRELNNGLYALLQGVQIAVSQQDFTGICLLSSASDDVTKLATIRDASRAGYDSLSRTVDQRIHCLTLDQSQRQANCISIYDLVIIQKDGRTIARYKDTLVLVDWRDYEEHDPNIISIIHSRIASLSLLLSQTPKPKEFHVLDCIGYCHDIPQSRFGLLFALPTLDDEIPEIISLHDLLTRQTSPPIFPTLDARFRLAHTLANSLLQLNSSKWLHRNLRSAHILFIKSTKEWFTEPYIVGFSYSREDRRDAASLPLNHLDIEDAYQHPILTETPRIGYRRDFDAYSLGLILLEIGFWRPISAFQKGQYSAMKNHRRLLEFQLTGDLAHRMGEAFEGAVRLLLGDRAYEGKSEGEQLVWFLEKVVSRVDGRDLS